MYCLSAFWLFYAALFQLQICLVSLSASELCHRCHYHHLVMIELPLAFSEAVLRPATKTKV